MERLFQFVIEVCMDFYKILSGKTLFFVFLFGFLVVIKLFSFVVGLFDDLPVFFFPWFLGLDYWIMGF